ncbi:MAG TPA: NAD(P)-binding domain-containing protein, partial [Saprospiraceae bacterium]|nr:NAD(P)-binding domain-containing protein [Saprospiraceae bacterium]
MDTCYDLVVIGAGPIGLACGLEAQEAGLRYVIIEKGTLVDSIYRYPANMTFFSSSERLEIGGVPFVSQNAKPSRSEALEYYRRVAESKRLDIRLYENVEQVTPLEQGPGYCVETAKGNYLTHNIALATGFYGLPVKLGIPGEDLPKVTHYYAEPHPYYRQQLVVVGAMTVRSRTSEAT